MKKLYLILIAGLLMVLFNFNFAHAGFTIELFGGGSISLPTPLTIEQAGYEDIKFTARYKTKSFNKEPYYMYRLSWWKEDIGYEVELIHHKLILTNPPDEVQEFQVSHGYNLLLFSRAKKYEKFMLHLGIGVVIAHPEARVRGKANGWKKSGPMHGFYLSGLTSQVAIGKRFPVWKKMFLAIEGKATFSYAWQIPIENGNAKMPDVSFHGLFGIGWDF